MADLEKLRPCGRFELFSTARHHLGFFKNVACAATFSNTSSDTHLQDLVYRALHTVIARHSVLSAIVLNEEKQDSEVYFARLPSVDLRTCVEFVERKQALGADEEDSQLEQVLQDGHRKNYRQGLGSKPFWHLVVLHTPGDDSTFTAAWFFHHALGDGGCGPIFHRTFLSALQTASSSTHQDPTNPIVPSPSTPLLPAFEDLRPHPLSWPFFLRAILGSLLPSIFDRRPQTLWTGPPITAPTPLPPTNVKLLTLSAKTSTRLLELSRANKTTLQATLECCIASALFAVLPAETYDTLITSGPISLRATLQKQDQGFAIANDDFLLALAQYKHTHTRASLQPISSASTASPAGKQYFPWHAAHSVRSTIISEVSKNGTDNVISLLRYVSDLHKYFTEKIGQQREISFELSNLGAVFGKMSSPLPSPPDAAAEVSKGEEGAWKLGRCVFTQSANITGPPLSVSVVSGGDGCCVLAFAWLEGVLSDEMVGAVVEGVEERVGGLVSSPA